MIAQSLSVRCSLALGIVGATLMWSSANVAAQEGIASWRNENGDNSSHAPVGRYPLALVLSHDGAFRFVLRDEAARMDVLFVPENASAAQLSSALRFAQAARRANNGRPVSNRTLRVRIGERSREGASDRSDEEAARLIEALRHRDPRPLATGNSVRWMVVYPVESPRGLSVRPARRNQPPQ